MGAGIAEELHFGPMSEVAPGWKLRVLLAQALFSDPDILLLESENVPTGVISATRGNHVQSTPPLMLS